MNSAAGDGREKTTVALTWTPAENAQVHFVAYIKADDLAAGRYGAWARR